MINNNTPFRGMHHFYYSEVVCERSPKLAQEMFVERTKRFCESSSSEVVGHFYTNDYPSVSEFKVPGFKITVEKIEQKAQSS